MAKERVTLYRWCKCFVLSGAETDNLVEPSILFIFQDVRVFIMGFWRFPDASRRIAFACYPPRSETSHGGGLVDLFPESHKSSDLSAIVDC
jgi:hypothetical protein